MKLIVTDDFDFKREFSKLRAASYLHAGPKLGFRIELSENDKASRFIMALDESNAVIGGIRIQTGPKLTAETKYNIFCYHKRKAELKHLVVNNTKYNKIQCINMCSAITQYAINYCLDMCITYILCCPNKEPFFTYLLETSTQKYRLKLKIIKELENKYVYAIKKP